MNTGDKYDVMQQFLKDINKYPLLDRAQEIELAKQIEKGNKKAFEKFVNSNLRLVVFQARRYPTDGHLKLLDHIQEGNSGLITAVRKFDWRRAEKEGTRFSTFAIWWIRQVIERNIKDADRIVRLPVNVIDNLLQVRRAEKELTKFLGYHPSISEIAYFLGITEERVAFLKEKGVSTKSLQDSLLEDGEATVGDMQADKTTPSPDMGIELSNQEEVLRRSIEQAIDSLPDEEKVIFQMIYNEGKNFKEISEKLGMPIGKIKKRFDNGKRRLIVSKVLEKYRDEVFAEV